MNTNQKTDRFEEQLRDIEAYAIPNLLDLLPADSWVDHKLYSNGESWIFSFECRFATGLLNAHAKGASPMEAFEHGLAALMHQIHAWRESRHVVPPLVEVLQPGKTIRILIADDDVDTALSMQTAFNKLGCHSEIATTHIDLHQRIVASDVDYIFLDWRLSAEMTADIVVWKAARLIETFSDLKEKFARKKPQVITHSVLERGDIDLPAEARRFFSHVAHWQKPIAFDELVDRASRLVAAN